MRFYKDFWKRAFDFKGVTSRYDYWMTVLINTLLMLPLEWITLFTRNSGGSVEEFTMGSLFAILIFVPNLAMMIRRFHDINKSGIYMLLGCIPLVGTFIVIIMMMFRSKHVGNPWYQAEMSKKNIIEVSVY
jgi:uncharacterized membrane protein YhaH (DUF805 family)